MKYNDQKSDTLLIAFAWHLPRKEESPIEIVSSEAISRCLTASGLNWLVLPLPFGEYRIPVIEDAEFLVDFYTELETLSNNNCGQADCVLNDGGLQIRATRRGETIMLKILIVPLLDGRFSTTIDMSMPSTDFMNVWRNIISSIVAAGCHWRGL